MKKLFLILLGVILLSDFIFAAGNNIGSDVVLNYSIHTSKWYPVFKNAATFIFASLAVIELIWIFSIKAIEGSLELSGIFAQLIRLTFLWGIWNVFFAHPEFFDTLVGKMTPSGLKGSSFSMLADRANAAAGVSTVISVDNLTDSAYLILGTVGDNQSIFHPVDSIILGLIGLLAAGGVLFLALRLVATYVKFLITVYASVLFFAFGAMAATRHIAVNAIFAMLRAGTEYMLIKLIIGLSIANIISYVPKAMMHYGSLVALLIMVLLIGSLAQMVHGLVEGWFSGMGAQTSDHAASVLKGSAMGAAAGAAGGAAAGLSSVKAAAAAAETKSSMENVKSATGAGSNTSEQNGKGTEKTGNFKKSKASTTVAASAAAGAASGALKGLTGFSTHGAGRKSGAAVASMLTGTPNKEQEKKSSGDNDSEKVEGSIASAKSKYVSGVPGTGEKNDA
ncbi:MAG: hypothetical protein P794_03915 [Epsilonproteobacteria bacterium (ex Lamellibrachia satsuma)]|nr:MAG: hypothetical protein P794_03915 [Epsilonproteobacteria bacterium (ex Lamellibrachia satsuma)]